MLVLPSPRCWVRPSNLSLNGCSYLRRNSVLKCDFNGWKERLHAILRFFGSGSSPVFLDSITSVWLPTGVSSVAQAWHAFIPGALRPLLSFHHLPYYLPLLPRSRGLCHLSNRGRKEWSAASMLWVFLVLLRWMLHLHQRAKFS